MPKPSAGRYRHRVDIQSATTSRNHHGDVVQVWTTIRSVRAFVRYASGKEVPAALRMDARVTHRVEFRDPRFRVLPTHRLMYNGRILNIRNVDLMAETIGNPVIIFAEESVG